MPATCSSGDLGPISPAQTAQWLSLLSIEMHRKGLSLSYVKLVSLHTIIAKLSLKYDLIFRGKERKQHILSPLFSFWFLKVVCLCHLESVFCKVKQGWYFFQMSELIIICFQISMLLTTCIYMGEKISMKKKEIITQL